ncbi:SigE family RNA polymerase sigma factor [Kitasatospora sp. NBC_01287]|uniref:SigE family RNA polymerase sigma factor n=1 Tax=Kitasatospora sp. NBC_01287 TaxID=2903573 RepID=UPI0022517A0F|nr:SigE family RNA polymerase sigma factor [Kitasatospora sp. NBC_01287]MCX4748699.1 SigE family RNA polymerase sigma factor [Kitasatospora sp. NBC_01287]
MAEDARDAEFTNFVAARAGWLRKVAYLLCGDWHRADDLVQETITKLYTSWGRVSRADNMDGYARRVLVNIFLAEQRSGWGRWVARLRGEPEPSLERPASVPDLEAALDLRQALSALPPRQRAAVVLRYHCDLSVEQTAEALGCSVGNVKSQTSRGLGALRNKLGGPLAVASPEGIVR